MYLQIYSRLKFYIVLIKFSNLADIITVLRNNKDLLQMKMEWSLRTGKISNE